MSAGARPGDLAALASVAGLRLAFCVATAPGYGIFRDELYYLACADHLALGYVDHPPFSIAVLWVWRTLFGDGLVALRFLPAVAGSAAVFATGLIARELGGGRSAQLLAALSACFAPFFLAVSHFYSMNAFDLAIWAFLLLIATRVLMRDEPRLWLAFGALAGLGLHNKYSVAFLGFGLVVGLALTRERRQLRSPWLWAGGALALVLFAPHLAWQAANGAPSLEFMRNATSLKNEPVSPAGFVAGQLLLLHPLFAPLWIGGLVALLVSTRFERVRALGIAYLAILALMIAQRAKVYYLAPAYPVLFAAGSVALDELFSRRGWRRASVATGVAITLAGVALLPMAIPVLEPDTFLAYGRALGISAPKMERGEQAELPQTYADMFGWRELADEVARVYRSLPEEDRARVAIFGRNYGEAGAIDYFGPALGLPRAVSPHNAYWTWGTRGWDGRVVIVIGEIAPESAALFASIEKHGERRCARCTPYEAELPIYVARDVKVPVAELWARLKRFQ